MLIALLDDTDHEVSMQVNASDSPGTEDNARIPATFAYAGIDVERQGLFSGTRGRQIAGRFTLISTLAFPFAQEWQGLVVTLEDALRLHRAPWPASTGISTSAPGG
jgi:hypothetical protein